MPSMPSMPSAADILLTKEEALDQSRQDREYKRKRERREDKERIEDAVGPKESGREGMLEKKKMRREGDRSFREAKDDTFGEVDDSTLMGGGDSFQARYVSHLLPVHVKLKVLLELLNETLQGRDSKKNVLRCRRRKNNALTT